MSTPTVAEITPTVGEVAAHILFRTRDDRGTQLGTFTADTEPTDAQAQIHIADAAEFVALKLGTVHTTWTGDLAAQARRVVARFAVLYIESSLQDGNEPDDTSIDQLGRVARERLAALLDTARDNQPGARPFTTLAYVGEAADHRRLPWSERPLAQPQPLKLTGKFRRRRR